MSAGNLAGPVADPVPTGFGPLFIGQAARMLPTPGPGPDHLVGTGFIVVGTQVRTIPRRMFPGAEAIRLPGAILRRGR